MESQSRGRRYARDLQLDSDEEEVEVDVKYDINPAALEHMAFLRSLLIPFLEAYSVTASTLDRVVGRSLLENDLVKETLDEMKVQFDAGDLIYGKLKLVAGRGRHLFYCLHSTGYLSQ